MDKNSRDDVEQYLDHQLKADMGGTELLSALQGSVETRRRHDDLITQIIAFTDAKVWAVEPIFNFVRETKEKEKDFLRMFCLGIGDEVSHRLVEGIGRYGGGFGEVVSVDSPSSWDDRIIRLVNCVFTPSDWKCEVSLERRDEGVVNTDDEDVPMKQDRKQTYPGSPARTGSSDAQTIFQAPHRIPTVYGLSRTVIYFLVDSTDYHYDQVTITGASSSRVSITKVIPITPVNVTVPIIHHVAAKALINDLETGQSWMHDGLQSRYNGDSVELGRAVILEAQKIGTMWSIPGRWASFVSVRSDTGELGSRMYQCDRRELSELARPRLHDSLKTIKVTSNSWTDITDEEAGINRASRSYCGVLEFTASYEPSMYEESTIFQFRAVEIDHRWPASDVTLDELIHSQDRYGGFFYFFSNGPAECVHKSPQIF